MYRVKSAPNTLTFAAEVVQVVFHSSVFLTDLLVLKDGWALLRLSSLLSSLPSLPLASFQSSSHRFSPSVSLSLVLFILNSPSGFLRRLSGSPGAVVTRRLPLQGKERTVGRRTERETDQSMISDTLKRGGGSAFPTLFRLKGRFSSNWSSEAFHSTLSFAK